MSYNYCDNYLDFILIFVFIQTIDCLLFITYKNNTSYRLITISVPRLILKVKYYQTVNVIVSGK